MVLVRDAILFIALCDAGVFTASEIAARAASDLFRANEILDGLAATGRLRRRIQVAGGRDLPIYWRNA